MYIKYSLILCRVICEAFNQTAVCDELMNKALGDFLDKMTGYSINYISKIELSL